MWARTFLLSWQRLQESVFAYGKLFIRVSALCLSLKRPGELLNDEIRAFMCRLPHCAELLTRNQVDSGITRPIQYQLVAQWVNVKWKLFGLSDILSLSFRSLKLPTKSRAKWKHHKQRRKCKPKNVLMLSKPHSDEKTLRSSTGHRNRTEKRLEIRETKKLTVKLTQSFPTEKRRMQQ